MKSLVSIALLIVALVLIKIYYFPAPKDDKNSPATKPGEPTAKPMPPAATVSVFVLQPETLDNKLFASGSLLANETVELKPEISGKVIGLYINEGAPVSKGKLLVKLNDADLQAQLKKINAEIVLAEEKLQRSKQLVDIQGLSREEFDQATNQVRSLKADAEVLKVQISRTNITAPFDGILGLRNISVGSYITPQQIVTSIQQLNPVKIDFSIPERYAGLIKTGNTINFSTEGSDKKYRGTVYAFEPGIDASTRALRIRAKAENPGNKLLPGSFAKIELVLNKKQDALMVPSQAIIPILKGQQVFVCRNNKAVAVPVETGLRTETKVEILSGLHAGDSIIITGIMGLRPGTDLRITK